MTFTMEDALISPISLAVLSGAGVIENRKETLKSDAKQSTGAILHATETAVVVENGSSIYAGLSYEPYTDSDNLFFAYVIPLDSHGDISGQPVRATVNNSTSTADATITGEAYDLDITDDDITGLGNGDLVMVDYYYIAEDTQAITEIDIDVENFAGYYYLEADTLWRDKSGSDHAAEFVIPNCKIQSNFTFSMAASGDPSTFTFTMDAFPDYTKYNSTKKVLCAIRVIEETTSEETLTAKANLTSTYVSTSTENPDDGSSTGTENNNETDDNTAASGTNYNWRANRNKTK